MFKKQRTGIVIIGTIGIILGIFTLASHSYDVISYYNGAYILGKHTPWNFFLRKIIGILFSLVAVIASIYILKLVNWARKLFISITALDLLGSLFSTVIIIKILPFSKYGILREIGGNIIEFSSSLRFYYLGDFIFCFEYIPHRVMDYFLWGKFFLSIALPVIFVWYLSRLKIKELFSK